mmetsp:Transcript_152607/g.489371  ORF Transcript_152607/g.489371 Transcript_152607/m.489371 type:complete len:248 (-) Transcript_152607:236-979(-)
MVPAQRDAADRCAACHLCGHDGSTRMGPFSRLRSAQSAPEQAGQARSLVALLPHYWHTGHGPFRLQDLRHLRSGPRVSVDRRSQRRARAGTRHVDRRSCFVARAPDHRIQGGHSRHHPRVAEGGGQGKWCKGGGGQNRGLADRYGVDPSQGSTTRRPLDPFHVAHPALGRPRHPADRRPGIDSGVGEASWHLAHPVRTSMLHRCTRQLEAPCHHLVQGAKGVVRHPRKLGRLRTFALDPNIVRLLLL